MKRSGREGRWAEVPPARTRFAAEAAFLILVAVGAALASLSPLAIIGLMLVAWLLVAMIERASSREQARALAGAEETEFASLPAVAVAEEEPEELAEEPAAEPAEAPKPQVAFRWLFWRRRRAVEALAAPTAALEERPSRAHVRRLEPEPEPLPAPPVIEIEIETVVTEIVVAEKPPPGPSVTKRPLDLPGLEEPESAPAAPPPTKAPPAPPAERPAARPVEPAAEPPAEPPARPTPVEPPVEAPPVEAPVELPREPAPVAQAPPPPPEPLRAPPVPRPPAREWNIWDLEKRARAKAGNPSRDEEWMALFMHLRPYANADGVLPMEFDDLVWESFSELIQAA